jgi:hypothetical protein
MRRHPRRASVDPSWPRAWATSDRNGFISNHADMRWQFEWAGKGLINKNILVSADELDEPQRQLGTLVLPPDPPPIMNARPGGLDIDVSFTPETPVTDVGYTTEDGVAFYVTSVSDTIAPVFYTPST